MASSTGEVSTSRLVPPDPTGSIPARLNHLVEAVHPEGRGPFSPREISEGLEGKISPVFIHKILMGNAPNSANATSGSSLDSLAPLSPTLRRRRAEH